MTDDDATWIARERDRASIRHAILRYFWGLDRGDQTLHQSAFAPGGRLFIDGVLRRGPGAAPPEQLPEPNGVPLNEVVATTHHLHQSDIRFLDDLLDLAAVTHGVPLVLILSSWMVPSARGSASTS